MTTAFVLDSGGQLGTHQVGMSCAVIGRGVSPGLVVGTSAEAVNGADDPG